VAGIIAQVSVPLFVMLRKWMLEGALDDPFDEFFVAAKFDCPESRVWQDRYNLRAEMIPSFLTSEQAKQILLIGKSINFMRYSCNDMEWVQGISRAVEEVGTSGWEEDVCLGEPKLVNLLLDRLAEYINRLLVRILFDKYQLSSHLGAIKNYLLLGQGDTTQLLMERLSPDLDQPASKILRNNLVSVLDGALRASLAQYDSPDVLSRLDVRLLDSSEGDLGWDIFSLDYRVDAPINAIFTEDVMQQYLRLFNFLWRLKRMEFSLSATWSRQNNVRHTSFLWLRLQGESGATSWKRDPYHKLYIMRNEMHHLISNINYYIMFEVLESAWVELEADFRAAPDMDELVNAHGKYLDKVIDKALLGPDSAPMRAVLHGLFALVIRFHAIVFQVSDLLDAGYEDAERNRLEGMESTLAGKWGKTGSSLEQPAASASRPMAVLPLSVRSNITGISRDWDQLYEKFRSLLETQERLRFLAFRLDFGNKKNAASAQV